MDTIKFNRKNTLVVAHRGLSGIEQENTNAAFIAAGNRSYWGIETDVYRTLDGKFAISHDATTARSSGGYALEIEKSTLDTLRGLQFTDTDGKKDRYDLKISTPDEYIKICKRYSKKAVLELKSSFTKSELEALIEIINRHEYLDSVYFISFICENLEILREMLPDQPLQLLSCEFYDNYYTYLPKYRFDLDIGWPAVNREIVAGLHELGIKVNVWTVDTKELGEKLADMGVDYITSNILE